MSETAPLPKGTLVLDEIDAIAKSARVIDELVGELSASEAAAVLDAGELAYRELSDALASVRRHLRALMDAENLLRVESGGRHLKRTASRKVTTDWRLLSSALAAWAAHQAVDAETGELMPTPELCQLVADAFMAVAPLTGSARPREDAMRYRGLDPDTYTDSEWGTPTVRWE